MTFEQTRDILTLLQTEYPQSFSKIDGRMMQAKLRLWADEFANDDFDTVYAALRSIMSAGGREFAPNIGNIREEIYRLQAHKTMTDGEAWAMVAKACTNGIYGYREEFAKFPPAVQKAVGSAEQIHEWAFMDVDELHSVVASNFMRTYRITAQREKELSMIPDNVKQLLTAITDQMEFSEKRQISDGH